MDFAPSSKKIDSRTSANLQEIRGEEEKRKRGEKNQQIDQNMW